LLSRRIVHDHQRAAAVEAAKVDWEGRIIEVEGQPKDTAEQVRQKEKWKSLLAEARYLMLEAQIPLCRVAKRLGIQQWRLVRIRDLNILDPVNAFERKSPHKPFARYHMRVRQCISHMLSDATTPVSATDIL
jgi:hypothetical protein